MAESRQDGTLKRDSVGIAGIVFFVIAAAAPLAAAVATAPVVFSFGGFGSPLAYLAVGLILLLFSVGYGFMSHRVTSAAGLAAYVEYAFGRKAGVACGYVAMLSYGTFIMGLYGGFGFSASFVFKSTMGLSIPWLACAVVAWILVTFMGFRNVDLNVRVLGALIALEIAVLFAFDLMTVGSGGSGGISFEAFNPSHIDLGSGFGAAMLFAAVAYLGFEATAIYGEEAKSPQRTVAAATYVAVIVITAFYAVTMWSFSLAYGKNSVLDAAANNAGGFVLEIIPKFLGSWSSDVVSVLVLTSYFAAILALHNALSRYVMALGRAGGLPSVLGTTHARFRSPSTAGLVISGVTGAGVTVFALAGADPYLQLFSWFTGLGTLGIFVLQACATLAVIAYGRRIRSRAFWSSLLAPVLALIGLCGVIVLALRNWSLLSGANGVLAEVLPWLLPVVGIGGLVVAAMRSDALSGLARRETTDEESIAVDTTTTTTT
ncbi:hypothetical protein A5630_21260 [Mycolicibacterium mucogenicum]|uniref:Amino acid permease/ SLC12A domain-containing protein n=1 Tax=Mycolicibacterium mucogenicum TaxID=56689 RepID=A0A1A3H3N5_MYCMU|nr:APC family permease [Mycolicibacterium mucogenicum]OBJ42238.1 hypothetical protein A5630_21260 [Mycolicibacterium mucogenicum]